MQVVRKGFWTSRSSLLMSVIILGQQGLFY
jgi:hypothetical protein